VAPNRFPSLVYLLLFAIDFIFSLLSSFKEIKMFVLVLLIDFSLLHLLMKMNNSKRFFLLLGIFFRVVFLCAIEGKQQREIMTRKRDVVGCITTDN
jgi:hypothetical protein